MSIDFAATAKTIARIDAVIIESQTMAVSDLMRRTVVRPKMRGTPTVSQNCLVDHGRYFIHRRLSAYPERSSKSKLKTESHPVHSSQLIVHGAVTVMSKSGIESSIRRDPSLSIAAVSWMYCSPLTDTSIVDIDGSHDAHSAPKPMSPPPPPPIPPGGGPEVPSSCTVAASAPPAAPPAAPARSPAPASAARSLGSRAASSSARERVAARFICALVRPLTSSACDCRPATCACCAPCSATAPVAPVSAPRTACFAWSSSRCDSSLHTARYRRIAGFAGARSASFGLRPCCSKNARWKRESRCSRSFFSSSSWSSVKLANGDSAGSEGVGIVGREKVGQLSPPVAALAHTPAEV